MAELKSAMGQATIGRSFVKRAGIHLSVVALSFILSVMALLWIQPFPGHVIDFMVSRILWAHALAAIAGVLIPKVTRISCAIVFVIAFAWTGLFGIGAIRGAIYVRYYAVFDRFRDHLADPLPKSVSNLRFVPLAKQIKPDLAFQFDIAPADWDAILEKLKLERVEADAMLNPKDFFQYPYYLPLAGEYQLFQGKDKFGDVLTIKTDESHSHVIFRSELSIAYESRRPEKITPHILHWDDEDLKRMKRAYGK